MDKKEYQDSFTYHFFFNHGLFDDLMEFEDLVYETELFLSEKSEFYENSKVGDHHDPRFGKTVQFRYTFPGILWKSIFLNFYFFLEHSLDQICNNLKASNEYTLSLSDINGSGIFRSKIYLKKVCKIEKVFGTSSWENLNDLNKIRNVLVHSNGVFNNNREDIKTICNKYSIDVFEYDDTESIMFLKKEFCDVALKNIAEFFNKLYREMLENNGSH